MTTERDTDNVLAADLPSRGDLEAAIVRVRLVLDTKRQAMAGRLALLGCPADVDAVVAIEATRLAELVALVELERVLTAALDLNAEFRETVSARRALLHIVHTTDGGLDNGTE